MLNYVKDKVYVPPLSRDLPELRQRIVAAVDTIDVDMLQRVWQELDSRVPPHRLALTASRPSRKLLTTRKYLPFL
jgi:hypothetical protein